MSSFGDLIALVVTVAVFAGTIYGVIAIARSISQGMESTKASLKNKGLDVSSEGVTVKTSGRMDRDDYVDATQRGFIKAMNASSFGRQTPIQAPDQIDRDNSSSSSSESKKRRISRFKHKHGAGHEHRHAHTQ